ncbi:MAG TPA: 2-hydroxyacid dehydrogenase [Sedimenticola thiotaurini]|uniref:2-hydroxyacid dehydrogenase n=1 Tax=Sedimenticola thiotaurini TaxID=1543721 RepID=A0A831RHA0_9GAMM|nr:2-hydroxyacid dehydrogenase [Sedimenticola thiotaurini]
MPQPHRAVFLDLATVDRGDLDTASLQRLPLDWSFHARTAPERVSERIGDARIVVSNKVLLDRRVLERAPALELICIAATGTNNVELEAARERGIAVTNVTGYATASVVQHVFALILALTTRLAEYRRDVDAGAWQRSDLFCLLDHPIRELAGRRLGIVGYGELGRGVARLAQAFGMEVLLARRPGGPPREGRLPLAQLLPRVDVLSLHCPLTETTRGLIGAAELERMRPDALLINTARGGIVDEEALATALRRGRLGGAGIDVLAQEPPLDDSPLLQPGIPNLIVTPHIAWASRESRQRLLDQVAANIDAHLAGEQRNRVV